MGVLLRNLKGFLVVISFIFLSNCTKVNTDTAITSLHVNKKITSPYTLPAEAYLAMAKKQTGIEQNTLLIMASGRLIDEGAYQQAQDILTQMHSTTEEQINEQYVLLAKINLSRNRVSQALSALATVHHTGDLPVYYQVQYHELLATAYQYLGKLSESVVERIKLNRLLLDDEAQANNSRALWFSLTNLPVAELNTLAAERSEGNVLKGWVTLALISRQSYPYPQAMLADVEQWQNHYPNHPANRLLPSPLEQIAPKLYSNPKQIALLLPITGPLSGPGLAIKDGFMAAFDASGTQDYVSVRVYDTQQGNVSELYQQAINNGAEYVVGPLSKPDVLTVATMTHPIPTILLNDTDGKLREHAYAFGLSPTNEARQVAARARKQGLSRALIIAPAGPWGNDMVSAFSEQWQITGGRVVDVLHYGLQDDLNTRIRHFLQVSDSEAREKRLKQLLGHTLEATPQRRQDFDMIFLVAYPSKARQIMPLLRYYYLNRVPVYATSSVYSGSADSMKDRDLDGIIFCDMPWVFHHQMGWRNWPEQFNSYNRLYALGMDSYALSTQLNQLLLFPALDINDKNGVLYLNAKQHIARILVFAQFKQGLPDLMR
jgi:uncharacterized protein